MKEYRRLECGETWPDGAVSPELTEQTWWVDAIKKCRKPWWAMTHATTIGGLYVFPSVRTKRAEGKKSEKVMN